MPSSPRTASDAAELERSRLQFEKMTQTPVPKLILGLAAPTILSMLITSIRSEEHTSELQSQR